MIVAINGVRVVRDFVINLEIEVGSSYTSRTIERANKVSRLSTLQDSLPSIDLQWWTVHRAHQHKLHCPDCALQHNANWTSGRRFQRLTRFVPSGREACIDPYFTNF